ncbi:MAG: ATP synthase F0 subunit B [Desulfuromonadia bacterium]
MKRHFPAVPARRTLAVTSLTTLLLLLCSVLVMASGGEGGHGGGHGDPAAQMKDLMWRVVNFAILLGIVVWALKKADAKKALLGRSEAIEKALAEAEAARAAAERKFVEYQEKLARANQEIEEIQAAIRREGEAEKERIIAEAQLQAARIHEQARNAADQEVQKAITELRQETARLAVQLAEKRIRESLDDADQNRLVGEYLRKVVEVQ